MSHRETLRRESPDRALSAGGESSIATSCCHGGAFIATKRKTRVFLSEIHVFVRTNDRTANGFLANKAELNFDNIRQLQGFFTNEAPRQCRQTCARTVPLRRQRTIPRRGSIMMILVNTAMITTRTYTYNDNTPMHICRCTCKYVSAGGGSCRVALSGRLRAPSGGARAIIISTSTMIIISVVNISL